MSYSSTIYVIFMDSLFIIGLILLPLGFSFLFIPEKTLKVTKKLNHWVSTEPFFHILNKPRYQEKFIYRYHRIFGLIFTVVSTMCLYMLLFYTDTSVLIKNMSLLTYTAFGDWLLESLFYIFVAANILALIIGLITFFRPSILKSFESIANKWVDTDKKLEVLDKTRSFPESIFLKNPRIFGLFVILGATWIIINSSFNYS